MIPKETYPHIVQTDNASAWPIMKMVIKVESIPRLSQKKCHWQFFVWNNTSLVSFQHHVLVIQFKQIIKISYIKFCHEDGDPKVGYHSNSNKDIPNIELILSEYDKRDCY